MKLLALALAAFAAAAPALAQDSGSDQWDARITAVSGEVVVHPHDGGDEVAAAVDMPLEQGDNVTTAAGASAEISLDGASLITLAANSNFTLEDTRRSASIFSLSFGSLLAKIEKLGSQSLSVRTETSVAAVRGTEFGVNIDVGGGESHIGVFDEGHVEVQGHDGGVELLAPNQETSVRRGEHPYHAAPLRGFFLARREFMRTHVRGRLRQVHGGWHAIDRRAARRDAFRRGREQRRKMIERRNGIRREGGIRRANEIRNRPNERPIRRPHAGPTHEAPRPREAVKPHEAAQPRALPKNKFKKKADVKAPRKDEHREEDKRR